MTFFFFSLSVCPVSIVFPSEDQTGSLQPRDVFIKSYNITSGIEGMRRDWPFTLSSNTRTGSDQLKLTGHTSLLRTFCTFAQWCSRCEEFIRQFEGKLDLCFEDECIKRLLNRQATAGSESPRPPTVSGYRLIAYVITLFLIISEQPTSSHRGTTPVSVSQKPKRLYGYTDVHPKQSFVHFKSLQQDAEI